MADILSGVGAILKPIFGFCASAVLFAIFIGIVMLVIYLILVLFEKMEDHRNR